MKYTRFHTCAMYAPTRRALLTGRNHHKVGMGCLPELATSAPGYRSIRPNSCATLAETLKLNGYSAAHFGKRHEVPSWQTSPMGPFDQGWDKLREETFARQKALGVVPPEAELTRRHPEIPAWNELRLLQKYVEPRS